MSHRRLVRCGGALAPPACGRHLGRDGAGQPVPSWEQSTEMSVYPTRPRCPRWSPWPRHGPASPCPQAQRRGRAHLEHSVLRARRAIRERLNCPLYLENLLIPWRQRSGVGRTLFEWRELCSSSLIGQNTFVIIRSNPAADEAGRSKAPDHSGMGPVGPNACDSGKPTGRNSLEFFFELQDVQSVLLDFQTRGRDKWKVVHAWLVRAGRLQDDD